MAPFQKLVHPLYCWSWPILLIYVMAITWPNIPHGYGTSRFPQNCSKPLFPARAISYTCVCPHIISLYTYVIYLVTLVLIHLSSNVRPRFRFPCYLTGTITYGTLRPYQFHSDKNWTLLSIYLSIYIYIYIWFFFFSISLCQLKKVNVLHVN